MAELRLARNIDEHGRVPFGNEDGHVFGFYPEGDELYKQAHVAFAAPSREAVDRF